MSPFSTKFRKTLDGISTSFDQLVLPPKGKPRIWVHVSSLGEFEQIIPYVESLSQTIDTEYFFTFFSPSGFEKAKLPDSAIGKSYMVKDLKATINVFLDRLDPDFIFWNKYDFWWNHLRICHDRSIPSFLLNYATKNKPYYLRLRYFRDIFFRFRKVGVIDSRSAQYFNTNEHNIVIDSADGRLIRSMDNVSMNYQDLLVEDFISDQKVLIVGSAYLPEVEAVKESNWTGKIIIAPHHIDEEHIQSLQSELPGVRWTEGKGSNLKEAQVMYFDKIGELKYLYRYADLVVIGGGFGNGIHNTLEAAVYQIPVFCGPKVDGFPEIAELKRMNMLQIASSTQRLTEHIDNYTDQVVNELWSDYIVTEKYKFDRTIEILKHELERSISKN